MYRVAEYQPTLTWSRSKYIFSHQSSVATFKPLRCPIFVSHPLLELSTKKITLISFKNFIAIFLEVDARR